MEKLQFLDLTDLNPTEEEQLNNILYNLDVFEAVELPPENLSAWVQHHVGYHQEPVNGGEPLTGEVDQQQVEYSGNSHMMATQTMQFSQVLQPPSVYVSNMTANVNYVTTPPLAYPAAVPPFIPPVDISRKSRTSKTPTKRSPEVRRGMESPQTPSFAPATPSFTQPVAYASPQPFHYPPSIYYRPLMPQPLSPLVGVHSVYQATPVYNFPQMFTAPNPPGVHPHSEPREETTEPDIEPEDDTVEQPIPTSTPLCEQHVSEDDERTVDTVIIENRDLQQPAEDINSVVEIQIIESKVEKPSVTKAPPANAFKSAPNLSQKPPFPPSSKIKRSLLDSGPEFVDPPVVNESGPLKKSFASLFGSSERSESQKNTSMDTASSKPLAMIHPTVHNDVNIAPVIQNCVNKFSAPTTEDRFQNDLLLPTNLKDRSEKIFPDYDINMQRLGEFLTNYHLDHKPLLLQPRGLTNRSNYCYINAILQALVACPPFYNLMKAIPPSQENKNSKSRTPIIDSMIKFVNEFSPMSLQTRPVGRKEKIQATRDGNAGSGEVVTGPAFEPAYVYKMLGTMHAAFPVEGRQEDAEEFLSCLLNGLNDEMLEAMKLVEPQSNGLTNGNVTTNGETTSNRDNSEQYHEWTEVVNKNNKSVVTRRAEFGRTPLSAIFRGQMRSRLTRAGGENSTTDNVQPFFTLQLDVEKSSSVEKALELLVGRDEVLGGTCPKTNQEISMFTQTSLEELPIILLLHLKCFDYKLHTCSKIIKTVEFPIDLKIDNKLLTSKSKTPSKDRQYKLLAVVYHDGKEATKGHYLTDVYHTGYNGWVRFDDATVRPVTPQQVLNPKAPRVPYLLYYRRCDTIGLPLTDKNR